MKTETVHSKVEDSVNTEAAEELSLWSFSLSGVIGGLGTGILNNIWIMAFPYITTYGEESIPVIDSITVTILSFAPVFLAAFAYYFMCSKGIAKGTKIYVSLGIIVLLASLYFPLFPSTLEGYLPEEYMGDAFAAFTIPMHIIATAFAVGIIPWFVKSNH